ncbi:expressed unknown protein [Seminavis robusta]|uniref:Uncharacterized protein n=1 Tax=Seminavis robusta TaxID=568900 RepID=A0A9N8D8N4_9STRA|nr:expressed unknown protein [Seminavis robusta]|eukprot:Sro37_g023140.1 n/a (555) ;mRNA; f:37082-38986
MLQAARVPKTHQGKEKLSKAKQRHQWYNKYKEKKAATLSFHYDNIWNHFPKGGLDLVKIECLRDNTDNYGLHQSDLQFDQVCKEEAGDLKLGTRSLGYRYENEHTVRLRNRELCPFSEKNMPFLQAVRSSLLLKYPKDKLPISEFLRVNLVVGAMTGPHTDTMRGATPNYFMSEPESDFQLELRRFPNFRCSVVLYKGCFYIPHTFCPEELVMIGFKDGAPFYYVFPNEIIDNLQPYGELTSFIVVGIKQKKLQVIPWKYEVFQSTKSMELKSMEDAIAEASKNTTIIGRNKYMYFNKSGVWYRFFGWRNIHRWSKASNHLCKRVHIFFRPATQQGTDSMPTTAKNRLPFHVVVFSTMASDNIVDLLDDDSASASDSSVEFCGVRGVHEYHVHVAGRPKAMSRPIFLQALRRVVNPSSKAIKDFRSAAQQQVQHQATTVLPVFPSCGVSLKIWFMDRLPNSCFVNKNRHGQLRQPFQNNHLSQFRICKPDTDNLVKLVLDALNGVAYKDDKQVVAITAFKLADTVHPYEGRTIVEIKEANEATIEEAPAWAFVN